MPLPGVHIETLHDPARYSRAQLDQACHVAYMLGRGKLLLVAPPTQTS